MADRWGQARVNGIQLHKLKCAKLKELIELVFEGKDTTFVYKIVNHLCNQAILGFKESTKAFKRKHDYPTYMSVADFLDPYAQVVRCSTETAFVKYITNHMDELKSLPQNAIIERFEDLSQKLLASHRLTGFADLEERLLTLKEARAYKNKLTRDRKAGILQPGSAALKLSNAASVEQAATNRITSYLAGQA